MSTPFRPNATTIAGSGSSSTTTLGAGYCAEHGYYPITTAQASCPACAPRGHCPTHGRIPAGYACPACELRMRSGGALDQRIDQLYERLTLQFDLILDLYRQLATRDALADRQARRVAWLEQQLRMHAKQRTP